MPKCTSSRLPHSVVRNVVCYARCGCLRERTGAMSGLAGAQTAAYGTLTNRAQFRRRVRMVLAAAPAQAVSRHFSQPLHCFHAEVRARCTPATANWRHASLSFMRCSVQEVSLVVANPENVRCKLHAHSSFTLRGHLDACVRSRFPHPLQRICAFARRNICGYIAPHLWMLQAGLVRACPLD